MFSHKINDDIQLKILEKRYADRVEIRAAVLNSKSRAIPERLHFVKGTVRRAEWLYNHYVDHVVYGMLKDDWNANLAGNPVKCEEREENI